MPTYAYACRQCDHRFDIVQSFSDATLTECPECDGTLRKEYGSIGVTFNGAGFYRTDSRTGSSTSSASSASSTATGGSSTPAPTSSKSEAKASPAPAGS